MTGIVRIAAAAQGAALGISELARELGNLALAHLHPAELGQNDDGQDCAPPMPASLGAAGIGHVVGQFVHQRYQASWRQGPALALRGRWLFIARQYRRQRLGAQSAPGFGIQGADPQLLGPLVTFIEILGYPRVAAGVVQAGPPSGFVSGAAKEL